MSSVTLGGAGVDEGLMDSRAVIRIGPSSLRNYFFGSAGNLTVSGGANVGVGDQALIALTAGGANVAVGDYAGSKITTTFGNVMIGRSAGKNAVTPTDCTVVGDLAGETMTTGTGGTFIGKYSFNSITEALNNTGIGDSTGRFTTTGVGNVAIGYRSFEGNLTGSNCVAIGGGAMLERQGGDGNIAIGYGAMGGAGITALGTHNIAIGLDAGKSLLGSADDNIFIGRDAGDHASQLDSADNSIAIGKDSYTTLSNQISLGSATHTGTILWGDVLLGRDVAAPTVRNISTNSVLTGTTNTNGANLQINGSRGTGTGIGGSIVFLVAPAGSTGSAQNALVTAMTIDRNSLVSFYGGLSVIKASPIIIIDAIGSTNSEIRFREDTVQKWRLYNDNTNDRFTILDSDNTPCVYLAQDATSWTAASDGRFPWKKNRKPLSVLDRIGNVDVFDFARDGGHHEYGVIAQDLYRAFPHLVDKGDDGDEIVTEWGVRYERAGIIALCGLKELHSAHLQLEQRVIALEARAIH